MNTWGYFLICELGRLLFCGGISELCAESCYYVVWCPCWKVDPQGDSPESSGTFKRSLGQSEDMAHLVYRLPSLHKAPDSIPNTA